MIVEQNLSAAYNQEATKYSHAPHSDTLVNDEPHVRQRSHEKRLHHML